MYKGQPHLKKVTPRIPSNPPLKTEVISSPLFENLVGGSPPNRKDGGAHYTQVI